MGKRKSSPRLATTPTIVMLLLTLWPKLSLLFRVGHFFYGCTDRKIFRKSWLLFFNMVGLLGSRILSKNVVKTCGSFPEHAKEGL